MQCLPTPMPVPSPVQCPLSHTGCLLVLCAPVKTKMAEYLWSLHYFMYLGYTVIKFHNIHNKGDKNELTAKRKVTQISAVKPAMMLYLRAAKVDTSDPRPSHSRAGTQLMSCCREVKGAATEASAALRDMPQSAALRAPQSLHPSPHMATRWL